jgi:hypothetical protein
MLQLDLAVPTDWERIDAVREAVARCVTAVFADGDLKDAVAMVSAELLENAFKYGKEDQGDVTIRVRAVGDRVEVSVTNAVEADSPHTVKLAERVAWVNEFGDPLAAYEAAMARAFTDELEQSGLGLARISYEGGCALALDTSQVGQITVTAACPLPAPATAPA